MFKLRLLVIALLLFTMTSFQVKEVASATEVPPAQPLQQIQTRQLSPKAQILSDYFAKYNSPLQYHAQDFVDASDQYGVDWKLVPAISGVESTFGTNAYGYNAWGWGIYGNQAIGFNSWRDGIFTVTEGLKTGYIDRGLTDPYSINRVYAASPYWGGKVTYFMNDLDKFANQYQSSIPVNNLTQTAAASAVIAYK